MFKRVDQSADEELDGYSYVSQDSYEFFLVFADPYDACSLENGDNSVLICYEDIPKLIKALELTHTRYLENKND